MTENEHGVERRVLKRVEYRVPTRQLPAIQAATQAAIDDATRHGLDPVMESIWYAANDEGGATLVFEVPVPEGNDDALDAHQRRLVLAAALDAPETATWTTLLEIARARSVTLRELLSGTTPISGNDAPVPAVLPRRWPEEVDRLVSAVAPLEPRQAAERIKQLVDRWVLAAVTVTESGTDPGSEPCD